MSTCICRSCRGPPRCKIITWKFSPIKLPNRPVVLGFCHVGSKLSSTCLPSLTTATSMNATRYYFHRKAKRKWLYEDRHVPNAEQKRGKCMTMSAKKIKCHLELQETLLYAICQFSCKTSPQFYHMVSSISSRRK